TCRVVWGCGGSGGGCAAACGGRPRSRCETSSSTSREGLTVELAVIRLPVQRLHALDVGDVVPRLGERDLHRAAGRGVCDPPVDVGLAGVVGGQRQLVTVLVHAVLLPQVAQIPAAVAHVQVGVEQVGGGMEVAAAGVQG